MFTWERLTHLLAPAAHEQCLASIPSPFCEHKHSGLHFRPLLAPVNSVPGHRQRNQTYGCQRESEGGINKEVGIQRYKVLCIKQEINKDLLYSTGNYIQYLAITYNGKEPKTGIYIYVCVCVYIYIYIYSSYIGFSGGSDSKESAHNVEDLELIPGLEKSPGEGNGNPLQYSCLENSMNRGAW